MKKQVAIVGAGAIGLCIGYYLMQANRDSFFYLATGNRLKKLEKEGVYFNGTFFPIHLVSPSDCVIKPDLIILCVKGYHLSQVLKDIQPLLRKKPLVLSLLNGLDSEKQIAEFIGFESVLYGISVGIDATRVNNKVNATAPGKIIFGDCNSNPTAKSVLTVKGILDRAGFSYEIPQDIIHFMWWKFMVNVGVNTISSVLHMPYGAMQQSFHARKLMSLAMSEVVQVADKEGIHLSESDIQNWYDIFNKLGKDSKTSTLQDIEAGRKTEIDLFSGKVCELGKQHKLLTPVNQLLFMMIKALEEQSG